MNFWLPKEHIYLSYASNIREIAQPLKNFQVNVVTFMRSYASGSRIYLSSEAQWTKDYYELELFKTSSFEQSPRCYKDSIIIWPLPNTAITPVIDHGRHYYNSHCGLTLCEYHVNHTDFFFFSLPEDSSAMINNLINNLDIFKKFRNYFFEKIDSDMAMLEKNKLILLKSSISEGNSPIISNEKFESLKLDFLKSIKADNPDTDLIKLLTPSELKCLMHLMAGQSVPAIANELCISKRTVEKHSENIRKKLVCDNKFQLISRYKDILF